MKKYLNEINGSSDTTEDKDLEIVQKKLSRQINREEKKKTEENEEPQYLVGWCHQVNINTTLGNRGYR